MASGITPSDDAIKQFENLKGSKLDFILYQVNADATNIVPTYIYPDPTSSDAHQVAGCKAKEEEKKNKDDAFKNYKDRVHKHMFELITEKYAKEAIFIITDFRVSTGDGDRSKVVLIKWCADSGVPVKKKMLLASSFDAFKQKLNGVHVKLQCAQLGELDYDALAASIAEKAC